MKKPLLESIGNSLTKHPWLKLISLALAVIIWFYVHGEMGRMMSL